MRERRLLAVSAATALLSLSGCFKSYVAVSFRSAEQAAQPAPAAADALASPPGEGGRPALRTVALRAPFACTLAAPEPRGAAGVAARARAVLQARCGAWLPELEKALAAGGFTVVSWRAVAAAEAEAGTPLAAARKLGADALLVVQSLDSTPLLADARDPGSVALHRSSKAGELLGAAALSEKDDRVIRRLVHARYRDGALTGVAADVEVTALRVDSAEPIFTWRARRTDALDGTYESRMLLRGRGGRWRPVVPKGGAAEPAAGTASAEDPLAAALRELGASIANDLTARLAQAR